MISLITLPYSHNKYKYLDTLPKNLNQAREINDEQQKLYLFFMSVIYTFNAGSSYKKESPPSFNSKVFCIRVK